MGGGGFAVDYDPGKSEGLNVRTGLVRGSIE